MKIRPTMKEVEIALHALQTKRPKFCAAAPEMQLLSDSRVQGITAAPEMQLLLDSRVQGITGQLLATTTHVDQPTHGCYNLEQEFLASADLPR